MATTQSPVQPIAQAEPLQDAHTRRAPAVLTSERFALRDPQPDPLPSRGSSLAIGETPVERIQRQKFRGDELGKQEYVARSIQNLQERDSEITLPDGRVYVAQFRFDGSSSFPTARLPQVAWEQLRSLESSIKKYAFA